MTKSPKVLLMGYRGGILHALKRLQISYTIWSEKNQAFGQNRESTEELAQFFKTSGPYTHVIAGTEAAVYAASVARRVFNARQSEDSIVLKCHDKFLMKSHLKERFIPMTDFCGSQPELSAQEIMRRLGTPVVVKERNLSGGRGIFFAHTKNELQTQMGANKIYEKFVEAEEASVESFIHNGEILFTNVTQYLTKGHINIVPATLSNQVQKSILELNQKVIGALGIRWGMTHMEVYLAPKGLLFGEIALRPPGGYIMDLLSMAYSFNAWEAFVKIELGENFVFPKTPDKWTAAWVLHPGPGKIEKIEGIPTIKTLPSFHSKKIKCKVGDEIQIREGLGNEVGHIIFQTKSKTQLLTDLTNAQKSLHIQMRST